MTVPPLVTIVTPTFNQAQYIAETIESILAQDYPNIEYIIIDDGSTDNTASVIARFSDRVQTLHQSNQGQARTINKGISLAKGKYVGYLSSDDILYPSAISKLVAAFEEDPSIVCAFPDSDLIGPASNVLKRNVCKPFDFDELVVRQECYIGPGALYRLDDAQAIVGWDPALRLAPDREFWIRLAARGRFQFIRETLAGYRTHPTSTSYAVTSEDVSREYLLVLDKFFGSIPPDDKIVARKHEAYGFANFFTARNCARSQNWRRAIWYYRQAILHHPPLASPYYFYLLIRMSVSKPIRLLMAKLRLKRRSSHV